MGAQDPRDSLMSGEHWLFLFLHISLCWLVRGDVTHCSPLAWVRSATWWEWSKVDTIGDIYGSGQTAKAAAVLLVVPLHAERMAQPGVKVQESCPVLSTGWVHGLLRPPASWAELWERCWWHGRTARSWQHFSWFVALGEGKAFRNQY